jgi:predicted Zn-dependent protease
MAELNGQLQAHVAEERQDATAWSLLARTSEALGLKLRSLRAQAEARAAMGDLGAAIDRLRSAQAASRNAAGPDIIEASVIDARLRELQLQRRQLAAELRGRRGPDTEDDRPSR